MQLELWAGRMCVKVGDGVRLGHSSCLQRWVMRGYRLSSAREKRRPCACKTCTLFQFQRIELEHDGAKHLNAAMLIYNF